MLNIKYIEEFKAGYPYLVVTSDRQGFLDAYDFFRNKPGGFLNDKSITGLRSPPRRMICRGERGRKLSFQVAIKIFMRANRFQINQANGFIQRVAQQI